MIPQHRTCEGYLVNVSVLEDGINSIWNPVASTAVGIIKGRTSTYRGWYENRSGSVSWGLTQLLSKDSDAELKRFNMVYALGFPAAQKLWIDSTTFQCRSDFISMRLILYLDLSLLFVYKSSGTLYRVVKSYNWTRALMGNATKYLLRDEGFRTFDKPSL